jgi:hypothetical protein
MTSREEEIAQIRAAMAAQEALRTTLGDAIVDVTLGALKSQLAAMLAEPAASGSDFKEFVSLPVTSPDEVLAEFRGHLPGTLAEKADVARRMSGSGSSGSDGERKLVTVLFADLSGFTALSEQFDPEVIRAFQDDLFREMATVVYQYEAG